MKTKQILAAALLAGMFTATGLTSHAQKGLGINAGVNFANITGKDVDDDAKIKTGFQAGITYDIGLADEFVIQPGISYVQNGTKGGGWIEDVGNNPKLHLDYIQVPVTFQYQPEVGTGKVLLGVGPYIGFGVGQVKLSNDDGSLKYDWDDVDLKKVDAGGKLLVGYQFGNGLSANLSANMGMVKLADTDDPARAYNTSFGITLGYKF
ncbi:MAG: porin family protein [Niabella sp.]